MTQQAPECLIYAPQAVDFFLLNIYNRCLSNPYSVRYIMTLRRLVAIVFIFCCVSIAWVILGTSLITRSSSGYDLLDRQVQGLWGGTHFQRAPQVLLTLDKGIPQSIELDSSDIEVGIQLEHRRKGLLWYSTYDVSFEGFYTFENPLDESATAQVHFSFPSYQTIYDDFQFRVGDVEITPSGDNSDGLEAIVELSPGVSEEIHITYKSRGLDSWTYSFSDQITTVKDFTLIVNTDFDLYNFPEQSISASEKSQTPDGWELVWQFENLVSDFDIGIEMPTKLNPGPLASRMSYFAPVSLLFFFTVLVVLGAVSGNNLHPMHYFFLGSSFFAFHLLFAYLVDHLLPGISFIIAASVSLFLVISYLWRVKDRRFALREAGLSQFLFMVLFSYAFFFEGYTGLVVTIGAILTLAALMQITAKVDWIEIFQKKE